MSGDLRWDDISALVLGAQVTQTPGSATWRALRYASELCAIRATQVRGALDNESTPSTSTPCVCIESPLAGDYERNRDYAEACMLDALLRGEAPFLGHLLYPRVLDDQLESERRLGIDAHKAWLRRSQRVAVYVDLGISRGMREAIVLADELQIPHVERLLGPMWRERFLGRPTAGFERRQ
jgi:hypothetical protein